MTLGNANVSISGGFTNSLNLTDNASVGTARSSQARLISTGGSIQFASTNSTADSIEGTGNVAVGVNPLTAVAVIFRWH